jgi:hypothetical protein
MPLSGIPYANIRISLIAGNLDELKVCILKEGFL